MPGDSEDVYPPGVEFDDEEDVEAREAHGAVDVEEVAGQECLGVGAEECVPGGVVSSGWRDTV